MKLPSLPLPILSHQQPRGGASSKGDVPPSALPELDLGSMSKRANKKKRAVALEDDEDPREEAQMIQLLQQVQKFKQRKENKRKREQIAARAKGVATRVRRNASKRAEETKLKQDKLAADLRSAMDVLRAALQEEVKRATALAEEQKEEMKAAVGALNEKYEKAAEVHGQMKALGECMRQHFRAVHSHILVEIDGKIAETEGVVQGVHNQTDDKTDSILALISGGVNLT